MLQTQSGKLQLDDYQKEIADQFDNKKQDFNLLLGQETDLIHHHFGVGFADPATFPLLDQDEIHGKLHALETAQVDYLISLISPLTADSVVFDGGSGRAGTALMVHERFGCTYHGVNISSYQLEFSRALVAHKGYADRMHFHHASMLDTGFASNTFDCLITNETTMYAPRLEDLFREFARIIRPGGQYVFATWAVDEAHENPRQFTDDIDRHYNVVMHERHEYFRALIDNDFVPEHVVDITDLVLPSFELRQHSQYRTGVEESFINGLREKGVHYFMARCRYLPDRR